MLVLKKVYNSNHIYDLFDKNKHLGAYLRSIVNDACNPVYKSEDKKHKYDNAEEYFYLTGTIIDNTVDLKLHFEEIDVYNVFESPVYFSPPTDFYKYDLDIFIAVLLYSYRNKAGNKLIQDLFIKLNKIFYECTDYIINSIELDENKESEQAVVTLLAVGQALTDYIIKESFQGKVSRYRVEQVFTDSLMVPLIPINTKKGD